MLKLARIPVKSIIRRPSDHRPVGLPIVCPYGKRAAGSVGPTPGTRIRLPVSEIESPNWYKESKGHTKLPRVAFAATKIYKPINRDE